MAVNSVRLGLAGGASAVPENIEDSTRWRGASADKQQRHMELQRAAFHAAGAALKWMCIITQYCCMVSETLAAAPATER